MLRVAGDVAALVVGVGGGAGGIGDAGAAADALVAAGGGIVAVGDVLGRRAEEALRRDAVERVVTVVGDNAARIGLARAVAVRSTKLGRLQVWMLLIKRI
jgi:hypothetical protein